MILSGGAAKVAGEVIVRGVKKSLDKVDNVEPKKRGRKKIHASKSKDSNESRLNARWRGELEL